MTARTIFTWRFVLCLIALLGITAGAIAMKASLTMSLLFSLAGAAVLAVPYLRPLRRRVSETARTQILLALALAALMNAAGPEIKKHSTRSWIRGWNVFHYYLGTEYFSELGYDDLYDAALAADRESERAWVTVNPVRNLATYHLEHPSLSTARYQPGEHFSDERWAAFKRDVVALQPRASASTWREIFQDRGYNPSPFWAVTARQLTRVLPPTSMVALKVMTSLDYVLLILTFVLVGRTFGLQIAASALLLFALVPGNEGRLAGGFLQYDWFCAIAAGLCWMKRERPVLSAAALAYATMARAFPLAFVVSALAPAVIVLVFRRRLDRFAARFATVFALCCALGVLIGSLSDRGFGAWGEFAHRITIHSEHHVYGGARVGLKHWFTHDQASLDVEGDERNRRDIFADQKGMYWAAVAVFLLAYTVSVVRRRRMEALLLGMIPIFALVVASRYYWAFLALLPCLQAIGPPGARRVGLLALAQAAIFAVYYLHEGLGDPSPYVAYTALNGMLMILFGIWVAGCVRWDLRVLRRARRLRASRSPPIPPSPAPVT
jgi:hypothetical protein